MPPRVSILIPCFNASRWVGQAIQSALDQTYAHTEVIVVDDGSTDASLEAIRSFGDRVRWETGPNRGANAARNRLLELAGGQWLSYLDADDYLLPEKIADQVAFLGDRPEADVLYAPCWIDVHEQGAFSHREALRAPLPADPWVALTSWRMGSPVGSLFRKQAVADVAGWREGLASTHEYDLYLRMLCAGKRLAYVDRPGAVWRKWSAGSISSSDPIGHSWRLVDILRGAVAHLRQSGQLTDTRRATICESGAALAQSFWTSDRRHARRLASAAAELDPAYASTLSRLWPVYGTIHRLWGFGAAARYDRLVRAVRSLLRR